VVSTLGRSQDVCKGAWFSVEGEWCVVSCRSLFKRLKVNEEEADGLHDETLVVYKLSSKRFTTKNDLFW